MFYSKEPKIKNIFDENMINNSNNISKENCDNYNNNQLPLFKKKNLFNEQNDLNKDDKTAKIIKEILGENNLEIIIKKTDLNKIKKFDVFYKKSNKNKIETGNFDIKFTNK